MEIVFRAQLKTFSNIKNFIENSTTKVGLEKRTLSHFESRLSLLESYWKTFEDRHNDLFEFEKELQNQPYYKDDWFSAAEIAYIDAKGTISEKIKELTPVPSCVDKQKPNTNFEKISLPSLSLPVFTGKYEEWESFKQRFTSMIKNSRSLSNVDKLQHLLHAVQGQAAQRLKGLEILDTNFDIAWEKLVRRYDNRRIRLFNNLEKLIRLPSVNSRNVQELNELLDQSEEAVRALRDLDCPVDHFDTWLVHCVVRKLDQSSRESWELFQDNIEGFSKYDDLIKFLERRIQSLERSRYTGDTQDTRTNQKNAVNRTSSTTQRTSAHSAQTFGEPVNKVKRSCLLCKNDHPIYGCKKFNALSQPQRLEFVKKNNLCLNCLQKNHFASDCPSTKRCFTCQGNHHSKLHFDSNKANKHSTAGLSANSSESSVDNSSSAISAHTTSVGGTILLATAQVSISDPHGNSTTVRALIDPAAERSFISQRAASLLYLDARKISLSIVGVGGAITSHARSEVQVLLSSNKDHRFRVNVCLLVLNELTRILPHKGLKFSHWSHIKGLTLADPHFDRPSKIDVIIGADVYPLVIQQGIIRGPVGTPLAQLSVFGWLLTGPVNSNQTVSNCQTRVLHTLTTDSMSEQLVKFWEVEEVPRHKVLTPDEQSCKDHFIRTHSRDSSGRYVFRLPF